MRKLLVVLAGVLVLVVGALPVAAAGNWAVTYMDPAPSRFEDGESYALGFWVLQHGNHPFEGKMEPVGLRFTGSGGESLTFAGTALPEAAHYATSVVVPRGVWRVQGIQGPFEPYEVGTLTVPGSLKINPVAQDMVLPGGEDYWGDVRPPGFAPGEKIGLAVGAPAAPQATATPREQTAAAESGGVPAYTLLIAAGVGALLAVAALRLTVLRRRREEPSEPSADTVVISG
ncbi:hypothetical protein AB0I81_46215 [Nonomuraea sp. NPDC050404]|uniref:hypothetical protein n=1 Tax=Nonomuraea sp. NPDC050404 TaxID=3155783 RepID=UPI0033FE4704